MPTNGTRTKISPQQVLGELAALSNVQVQRLVPQVFLLSARRRPHVLGEREAQLLDSINRPLPAAQQTRFDELVEKRRAGTLTQAEVRQLQLLTGQLELRDARRLRCLVELAGLRKTTVDKLMRTLGLRTPAYA